MERSNSTHKINMLQDIDETILDTIIGDNLGGE